MHSFSFGDIYWQKQWVTGKETDDLGPTYFSAITSDGMLGKWLCSLNKKGLFKLYYDMEIKGILFLLSN